MINVLNIKNVARSYNPLSADDKRPLLLVIEICLHIKQRLSRGNGQQPGDFG